MPFLILLDIYVSKPRVAYFTEKFVLAKTYFVLNSQKTKPSDNKVIDATETWIVIKKSKHITKRTLTQIVRYSDTKSKVHKQEKKTFIAKHDFPSIDKGKTQIQVEDRYTHKKRIRWKNIVAGTITLWQRQEIIILLPVLCRGGGESARERVLGRETSLWKKCL